MTIKMRRQSQSESCLSPRTDVAYIFEELSKKLPDTLESTQEYDAGECADPDEPPTKQSKLSVGTKATLVGAPAEAAGVEDTDEVADTLLCSICQEIFHDCVSLQPCMHTFCAGCFSQWMKTSKACPTCRKQAVSVARNHILRNLIEIYLKSHPEKQRPADDIAELDKNNAIVGLNMKLDNVGGDWNSDSGSANSSNSENSDYDDEDEDMSSPIRIHSLFNANIPVCRQCPGYDASRVRFGLPPTAAAPSAAATTAPFQCIPGAQHHIVCYCCMEMFPDRRLIPNTPPVSCEVCSGMFCHLYWGCKKPGCRGCINKLKDMSFEDSAMDSILLQNSTESGILKDHMQSKGVTLTEIVTDACMKLDRGDFLLNNDFNCNFSGRNLSGDSVVCHRCGVKALRQLAYFYRKNIPATDLPDAVTKKEDCYWGKNCRTQKKPGHAVRWNHICEQTRFT